jgi:UDP-N-acetyl-2-amino-2-deoxyglucuronate dehydrogenase
MTNFSLIGAGGYVAPRHMQAIRDTGGILIAAYDPNDSVGILDSYFPNANFFTEFERFDRFIDKQRRVNQKINYISICSPNYLHDSHIRFALRSDADAICEKPLVLNPWNIEGLIKMEQDTGHKVNTILQLRLHPSIISLKQSIRQKPLTSKVDVDLTYITSRGNWYFQSWKGDEKKSGGIATNIGVHFFDMLHFIFGKLQQSLVHLSEPNKAAGFLEYENARVRWFLSLDSSDIPINKKSNGQKTFRSLIANGEEIEFSDGFTELHTKSYEAILQGDGFSLEDNRVAIETVAMIRTAKISTSGEFHHLIAS